jgi:hypothetical protein
VTRTELRRRAITAVIPKTSDQIAARRRRGSTGGRVIDACAGSKTENRKGQVGRGSIDGSTPPGFRVSMLRQARTIPAA